MWSGGHIGPIKSRRWSCKHHQQVGQSDIWLQPSDVPRRPLNTPISFGLDHWRKTALWFWAIISPSLSLSLSLSPSPFSLSDGETKNYPLLLLLLFRPPSFSHRYVQAFVFCTFTMRWKAPSGTSILELFHLILVFEFFFF